MAEFNDRIAAQRHILKLVNRIKRKEELFGLSEKTISRWISTNQLDPQSNLVKLVKQSSEKLFFLANKSQEQISDEYKYLSEEIISISQKISIEVS